MQRCHNVKPYKPFKITNSLCKNKLLSMDISGWLRFFHFKLIHLCVMSRWDRRFCSVYSSKWYVPFDLLYESECEFESMEICELHENEPTKKEHVAHSCILKLGSKKLLVFLWIRCHTLDNLCQRTTIESLWQMQAFSVYLMWPYLIRSKVMVYGFEWMNVWLQGDDKSNEWEIYLYD